MSGGTDELNAKFGLIEESWVKKVNEHKYF